MGLDWVVKEVDKAFNHFLRKQINPSYSPRFPSAFSYDEALEIYNSFCSDIEKYEYWHEGEKINNAKNQRATRLRKRIQAILQSPSVFLTLTFAPDVVKSTSAKTRRTYVARFLKECGAEKYVANIDFGEQNGTEHYHAVIGLQRIDFSKWTYGNIDGKAITQPNPKRLARYIAKLTNHAIKATTRGCRVIYSR